MLSPAAQGSHADLLISKEPLQLGALNSNPFVADKMPVADGETTNLRHERYTSPEKPYNKNTSGALSLFAAGYWLPVASYLQLLIRRLSRQAPTLLPHPELDDSSRVIILNTPLGLDVFTRQIRNPDVARRV